jgi:hypothetical protein
MTSTCSHMWILCVCAEYSRADVVLGVRFRTCRGRVPKLTTTKSATVVRQSRVGNRRTNRPGPTGIETISDTTLRVPLTRLTREGPREKSWLQTLMPIHVWWLHQGRDLFIHGSDLQHGPSIHVQPKSHAGRPSAWLRDRWL